MAVVSQFKNIIWTHHVLERLKDRQIPKDSAWKTVRFPDNTEPGKSSGTTQFTKHIGNRKYTVIATQNDRKEWIVMSCWAQPPFPGSIDIIKRKAYLEYKDSTFTGKIWIRFKQILGLSESF